MEKSERKVWRTTSNLAMRCSWKWTHLCWCVCVLFVISVDVVDSKRNACAGNSITPKPCICNTESARPSVRCMNQNLTEIVYGIPQNIVILDNSFNKISKIFKNDFLGLEKMETLFLQTNKITEIHPEAFRNLYNLKLLVLENNEISSIPERLFQHLPNLENIKLRANKITTISRDAFITLPLVPVPKIDLNDNQIQCDCEIKALKQWMTDSPGRIKLSSAKCSNTRRQLSIKKTPDSDYPTCPDLDEVIPKNASCFTCQDVVNHQQCRDQGTIAQCEGTSMVCSSRIQDEGGKLSINKGCMWYRSCLNQERSNVRNCGLYNKPDRACNFCCVGEKCNAGDMGGRTKEFRFSLEMTLDRQFETTLNDRTSKDYRSLKVQVADALENVFEDVDGGQTVLIIGFSEPNITVHALIFTTNLNTHNAKSVKTLLKKFISTSASEDYLLELSVLPDSVTIDIYSGVSCREENATSTVGEIAWPITPTGKTAKTSCPNTSKRYAYRGCILTSTNEGSWLKPDIRACLINSSVGNELMDLLNIKVTAANVANVANNLKSLTAKAADFTTAQLSLAVNVLENVLEENSSFSKPPVMNATVAVVSQLMASKTDVLQEAEQKYQTSSKILDSVDTISNKISLNDGNVKIVQPNLVLAAVPVVDGNFSGLTITARSRSKSSTISDFMVKRDVDDDENDDNDDNENDNQNDNEDKDQNVGRIQTTTDTSREDDDHHERDDDYYSSTFSPVIIEDDFNERDNEDDDDDDEMERDHDDNDESSSFALPKTLFSRLSEAEKTAVERITFHVFPTGRLFSSIVGNKSDDTPQQINDNKFVTKINSGVISVSVPNVKIRQLQDPVQMTFSHSSKNSTNARCVFWDDGMMSGIEGWSSEGCRVLTSIQGSSTTCVCDHLTNFALLMDVYQDGYRISEKDKKILSIITYIGCSLSFICLALTLLTYIFFKKLRKDNPSKILVNLCISLAIANLIFIIGMHSYAMDDFIGCKVVAILLHYFLLSALSWMAVEAFYMYLALVLVFKTYYSKFMLKCAVVGYGIPMIIVVITLSISTDNYTYLDSGICWLTPKAFYGAFAAPVLVVLLINFVAFGLVLRQLCGLQARKLTKSDRSDKFSKVRGAVGVVILLGLTWIFAIFAIGPVQTIFSYLFAIFNALQGVFIFLFYCLFKKDAINAWRRFLPCCEVVDEKSSSRGFCNVQNNGKGYSGSTPASNSGNKTLSTYNGMTSVKRGGENYEVSSEDNIRHDQNNHNNNNADYDNNNGSLEFNGGYENIAFNNRPASSTYI